MEKQDNQGNCQWTILLQLSSVDFTDQGKVQASCGYSITYRFFENNLEGDRTIMCPSCRRPIKFM